MSKWEVKREFQLGHPYHVIYVKAATELLHFLRELFATDIFRTTPVSQKLQLKHVKLCTLSVALIVGRHVQFHTIDLL